MTDRQFDLIVLGSGPSGGSVATAAAAAGHRVAIIESRRLGGTCALRGCNPKKVYTQAADLIDRVRRCDGQLIRSDGVSIHWPTLQSFKNEFTRPVPGDSRQTFQSAGITTLLGSARFVAPRKMRLGDDTLTADRFCIAVGAKPMPLPIEGADLLTHSDDFFELGELPGRIVFVGGGYIAMEFAHVAARCGSEVTVVERGDRVLSGFDPDLVDLLTEHSRDRGVAFRLGQPVAAIGKSDPYTVTLRDGSSIRCDLVVHAAGRVPDLDDLDLAAGGIEHGKSGIRVDRYLRSVSNAAVFATGDCVDSDQPRLTLVANEQARIVAKNIFADRPTGMPDYGAIARVAFTSPSIAAVGMSQAEVRRSGRDVDVRFEDTSSWGSVRKTGRTVAGYKLLIDRSSDHILGAHLLGPSAEETINLFTLAITHALTAADLRSTLLAYPTFGGDIRRML